MSPELSRGICRSATQRIRCHGVLPCPGGELNREAVLVPIYWGEHPMPLSDQLNQLVELHRAAKLAMKGFILPMCPGELLPTSYFGLIKRMVNAYPRLEVIKQSVCIEGARRAFARAKMHWAKLDAEKLVKDGPPEGKPHCYPEKYYDGVMKGARLVVNECTKDIIFE